MWNLRCFSCLVLLFAIDVAGQKFQTKYQTLSGDAPLVIARGGFSGLFPDSSYAAYIMAMDTSLSSVIIWCDVQLTKDGVGVCFPDLKLDNASDIDIYYKNKKSEYLVNGVSTQGWFSIDFNFNDLAPVIYCFAHLNKNDKPQEKLLIITSEGASGDYPGCTDMAYIKAVSDGADVLDCPVQMTKDGIPFCLGSINLVDKITFLQLPFSNLSNTVPGLNITIEIFTFNFNWDEIQSLESRNDGNFVSLVDFLTYAKSATTLSGVMISIENAAYLANHGLGVIAAVLEALRNTGYNNQTAKKVMIQSKDSSVLKEFEKSRYELVYMIDDNIRDIESSTISEIKSFASSVILTKNSVFRTEDDFLVGKTDVVQKLHSSNLSVYVQCFNNEFVSQAWDFFSDSSVGINNYFVGAGIDGVITDFPRTAATYRSNPVETGGLLQFMARQLLPPAETPNPILSENDVVEPPLPPVAKITPAGNESTTDASPIGQSSVVAGILTCCCLTILLADLVIF
ncbi:hypothetical protein KY289_011686 [Solanum tuberosum]|nr:hypothetical protein KY289_011686 [Solanum tuberosum]